MRKRERNRIYRKALELQKRDLRFTVDIRTGLCFALQDALCAEENFDIDSYAELRKDFSKQNAFPEIVKHRPETFEMRNYWFLKDDEGIKKRISILEQAIEETK